MSKRIDGPYDRRLGVWCLALTVRTRDWSSAYDDGARASVITDRQVLPVVGQCRGVGTKDRSDVLGVLLRRIEVDVVSDFDGEVV